MADIPLTETIKNEFDNWKLLFKAGGENQGYLERMEACQMSPYILPTGCLIRITMQLQHADLTWSFDQCMCFVPGAALTQSPDPDNPGKFLYSISVDPLKA